VILPLAGGHGKARGAATNPMKYRKNEKKRKQWNEYR